MNEESRRGRPSLANGFIARMIREQSDVLVAIGAMMDNWRPRAAVEAGEADSQEVQA